MRYQNNLNYTIRYFSSMLNANNIEIVVGTLDALKPPLSNIITITVGKNLIIPHVGYIRNPYHFNKKHDLALLLVRWTSKICLFYNYFADFLVKSEIVRSCSYFEAKTCGNWYNLSSS